MAEAVLTQLTRPESVLKDRETALQQRACLERYLAALELSREVHGVVHVAGTKGKGSICATVESILRRVGFRTGLFTSPHLYDVRERIRIDGALIEAPHFDAVVTECHDRLRRIESDDVPFPGYFTFLTLVALKAFGELQLDVVVLEVGIGGRYDPTNLVPRPWVCGIASVGLDHQELLGHRLADIAWQKAGIMKSDVPVYSVPQRLEVMDVLQRCAEEVGTSLTVIAPHYWSNLGDVPLRGFRLENAALAVQLAMEFEKRYQSMKSHSCVERLGRLEQLEKGVVPEVYLKGIDEMEWVGRAQIVQKPYLPTQSGSWEEATNVRFYIDGAHTPESLEACVDWIRPYWQHRTSHHLDLLLFSCHQLRDPAQLLKSLHQRLHRHQLTPHYTLFAPQLSHRFSLLPIPHQVSSLEWQKTLFTTWASISPPVEVLPVLPLVEKCSPDVSALRGRFPGVAADICPSLPSAMKWVGAVAQQRPAFKIRVLATGSLYFVSDVLQLIQNRASRAETGL